MKMKRIVLILLALLLAVSIPVWAEKLTVVSGTKNGSGDNTLISAPGDGNRIILRKVQVQNESSTSTTILLKDGSTAMYRAILTSQGSGVLIDFDKDSNQMQLSPNAALVLNLSGANSHNYTIWYVVEKMR